MKDEILFAGKINGRAVMVYRSGDTLRINVSEDPVTMATRAWPVQPVNSEKIERAKVARKLGIDAQIPEPDYSGITVDYNDEDDFILALLAMNVVLEDTPWGYPVLSWDWSAFPNDPFDDGENGMRRRVIVRRKNGVLVEAKSWVGGYDTAIPDATTWDYIPEEFVDKFKEQAEEFERRAQERAAKRLAELQREFGD